MTHAAFDHCSHSNDTYAMSPRPPPRPPPPPPPGPREREISTRQPWKPARIHVRKAGQGAPSQHMQVFPPHPQNTKEARSAGSHGKSRPAHRLACAQRPQRRGSLRSG
eukprot:363791-Chlamydomonas_euryale.AAC.10